MTPIQHFIEVVGLLFLFSPQATAERLERNFYHCLQQKLAHCYSSPAGINHLSVLRTAYLEQIMVFKTGTTYFLGVGDESGREKNDGQLAQPMSSVGVCNTVAVQSPGISFGQFASFSSSPYHQHTPLNIQPKSIILNFPSLVLILSSATTQNILFYPALKIFGDSYWLSSHLQEMSIQIFQPVPTDFGFQILPGVFFIIILWESSI